MKKLTEREGSCVQTASKNKVKVIPYIFSYKYYYMYNAFCPINRRAQAVLKRILYYVIIKTSEVGREKRSLLIFQANIFSGSFLRRRMCLTFAMRNLLDCSVNSLQVRMGLQGKTLNCCKNLIQNP